MLVNIDEANEIIPKVMTVGMVRTCIWKSSVQHQNKAQQYITLNPIKVEKYWTPYFFSSVFIFHLTIYTIDMNRF